MKYLKMLPLIIVILAPLGWAEEGVTSVEVTDKPITNYLIVQSNLAIQKYDNQIGEVRESFAKVKKSRMALEQKRLAEKTSLAALENAGGSEMEINLLQNANQKTEFAFQQIQIAETELDNTLKKLLENRDLIKSTLVSLETRLEKTGKPAVDVLKNRISNRIQDFVGKGEIAIQKYKNKIREVRKNLINVKKLRMRFDRKLRGKKTQLAIAETSKDSSPERISALKITIQEMETFLQQVRLAETKIWETREKLVDNLELVKLKVAALKTKRDMLDALRTVQQYSNTGFEGDVDRIGADMESIVEGMQKDIDEIEAEIEFENILAQ
jgi:hypothetical protein